MVLYDMRRLTNYNVAAFVFTNWFPSRLVVIRRDAHPLSHMS